MKMEQIYYQSCVCLSVFLENYMEIGKFKLRRVIKSIELHIYRLLEIHFKGFQDFEKWKNEKKDHFNNLIF